jgi:sterol desaturase/sphingolipid hydroxylase (fatty acid hydroxylase superfamily)
MLIVRRVLGLYRQSGALPPGHGKVSGVIAFSLAILCLLAVFAWHFPEYLTTPELRRRYSVDRLRDLLFLSLLVSGGLSLANLVLGRMRWLNGAALSLVLLAIALGGSRVPVGDFPDGTPYLGVDWLILDLLGSSVIFILIEKLFPIHHEQPVFRADWQTDFTYFIVNHLLIGLVLLIVNFFVHDVFARIALPLVQQVVHALPLVAEALLAIFVADLIQYWTHRAYHEVPALWRFHAVHHSAKTLDWMAGSRLHLFELLVTRVAILAPLYFLGFSKGAIDVYIVVVGFQAVFNHANVDLPWGRLEKWIVTPRFHHWHHGSDRAAIDRNYAAHFSFLDTWFGTRVDSEEDVPERYGVVGDDVPHGFVRQQLFPFQTRRT